MKTYHTLWRQSHTLPFIDRIEDTCVSQLLHVVAIVHTVFDLQQHIHDCGLNRCEMIDMTAMEIAKLIQ